MEGLESASTSAGTCLGMGEGVAGEGVEVVADDMLMKEA